MNLVKECTKLSSTTTIANFFKMGKSFHFHVSLTSTALSEVSRSTNSLTVAFSALRISHALSPRHGRNQVENEPIL